MARKRTKAVAHNGGHIRPTEYGTWRAEVCQSSKQVKKTHRTQHEAREWIDSMQMQYAADSHTLGARELQDAREALDALPDGVSLLEAAREWTRTRGGAPTPILATDALARIIIEKTALGRRTRTADGYSEHVGKFLREFSGDRSLCVHEITTEHIKCWLQSCGYSGSTWNGYRRTLHAFFAWCQGESYTSRNPVENVPTATTSRDMPRCCSVASVIAFMEELTERDEALVPYYATGFFAGIRTAELGRMDASCFGGNTIHIGPQQAKTHQQRYVSLSPNLEGWLKAFPPTGALKVRNHRRRYEAICGRLGIRWPRNAMRHSFASYHLACHQDAARTAHEMGHRNADLLYNTYRTLATQNEGISYFEIRPIR